MQIEVNNTIYTVSFTKKNIKGTFLRVKGINKLHITSPYKINENQARKLIINNLSWLASQMQKIRFSTDNELVLAGKKYQLIKDELITEPFLVNDNTIYYKDQGLHKLIVNELKEVESVFKDLALPYGEIKLRFRKMKTRWGVCNWQKRIITLNSLIIMLPLDLVKYVIYHELTHLLIHNHKSEFHIALKKVLNNYKELHLQLKDYALE